MMDCYSMKLSELKEGGATDEELSLHYEKVARVL